jgi:hypothetical protein
MAAEGGCLFTFWTTEGATCLLVWSSAFNCLWVAMHLKGVCVCCFIDAGFPGMDESCLVTGPAITEVIVGK